MPHKIGSVDEDGNGHLQEIPLHSTASWLKWRLSLDDQERPEEDYQSATKSNKFLGTGMRC